MPRGSVDELAHREEPEDVVGGPEEALERLAALFNAERFFEAHEFAEYIWKHPTLDPKDREFWKGTAQLAVGCCHVQRGNRTGAITLLERAQSYLAQYTDPRLRVDPHALAGVAERTALTVRHAQELSDVPFERFPQS